MSNCVSMASAAFDLYWVALPTGNASEPVTTKRHTSVSAAPLSVARSGGITMPSAIFGDGLSDGVLISNVTTENPDSVVTCAESHGDPTYVDLGGTEVSKDTLAEPGVPRSEITLLPATALDSFFVDPGLDSAGAPQDGWRPILEEQDRVVIAAPMRDGKPWYYARFTKDNGEWKVAGWGATEPIATAAQRGAGLELEWLPDTTVTRDSPNADILLVNDRSETSVDDRGEYVAYVHLFDAETGKEV